jgi:hypothetical protein
MDGTIDVLTVDEQTVRALREENQALRRRVAELERVARFHARSANKLLETVMSRELKPDAGDLGAIIRLEPAPEDDRQPIPAPPRRFRSRVKGVVLASGRKMVRFARRHRSIFAPHGSLRERLARRLMATQRRLRGIAA